MAMQKTSGISSVGGERVLLTITRKSVLYKPDNKLTYVTFMHITQPSGFVCACGSNRILCGLSLQENYTDQATAAYRQN
jgi:hypothetical protein